MRVAQLVLLLAVCGGAGRVAAQVNARQANCISNGLKVSNTGLKSASSINKTIAFDEDAVKQHFDSIAPLDDFRPNTQTTFSCVDSRGEVSELGTPGGDFAELAAATYLYLKMTGGKPDQAKDILFQFVDKYGSAERPFYMHSSDVKLQKVFKHLAEDKRMTRKPSVFPETMPKNAGERDAWLDALSDPHLQGCGHVNLMMEKYADYGMDSDDVMRALVRAFYEYWWPTPAKSAQRDKVKFAIVQGPLDGHATVIVSSTGCPNASPAIPPSHGGSQVFVYHAAAVDDFRKLVLTPFFTNYAKSKGKELDATKFYNDLKSLQGKMLAATLNLLAPVNALGVWSVDVNARTRVPTNVVPTRPQVQPLPDFTNVGNVRRSGGGGGGGNN